MPTPQYSGYPLEQAVFEQVFVLAERIKDSLKSAGPTAVALGCNRGAAWVLNDHLVFSEDVSSVNDVCDGIVDNLMGLAHFEGIGVLELEEVRDSLQSWLNQPEVDHAPVGTDMGECLGLDLDHQPDPRQGQYGNPPRRHRVRDDNRVQVVFRDVSSGPEIGQFIQIGDDASPEEVSEEQRALLGGSEYVRHITAEIPELDDFPTLSCISELEEGDRLMHLCFGQPFTPTVEAPQPTTHELKRGDVFAIEYRFSVSQEVANALRSPAA